MIASVESDSMLHTVVGNGDFYCVHIFMKTNLLASQKMTKFKEAYVNAPYSVQI